MYHVCFCPFHRSRPKAQQKAETEVKEEVAEVKSEEKVVVEVRPKAPARCMHTLYYIACVVN